MLFSLPPSYTSNYITVNTISIHSSVHPSIHSSGPLTWLLWQCRRLRSLLISAVGWWMLLRAIYRNLNPCHFLWIFYIFPEVDWDALIFASPFAGLIFLVWGGGWVGGHRVLRLESRRCWWIQWCFGDRSSRVLRGVVVSPCESERVWSGLVVNASIDNGFDVVVDTVRIHVQALWFGGLYYSLTDGLWTFSTGCTLSLGVEPQSKAESRSRSPSTILR